MSRKHNTVPKRQWIISVKLKDGQTLTICRYATNAAVAEAQAKQEFDAERAVCRSEFRS